MSRETKKLRLMIGDDDVTEEFQDQVFVKCFCCDELRALKHIVWSQFKDEAEAFKMRMRVQESMKQGNKCEETNKE